MSLCLIAEFTDTADFFSFSLSVVQRLLIYQFLKICHFTEECIIMIVCVSTARCFSVDSQDEAVSLRSYRDAAAAVVRIPRQLGGTLQHKCPKGNIHTMVHPALHE